MINIPFTMFPRSVETDEAHMTEIVRHKSASEKGRIFSRRKQRVNLKQKIESLVSEVTPRGAAPSLPAANSDTSKLATSPFETIAMRAANHVVDVENFPRQICTGRDVLPAR